MRYKTLAQQRLDQLDASINTTNISLNHGFLDRAFQTLESLKEQVQQLRELIDVEDDEFAQQFKK